MYDPRTADQLTRARKVDHIDIKNHAQYASKDAHLLAYHKRRDRSIWDDGTIVYGDGRVLLLPSNGAAFTDLSIRKAMKWNRSYLNSGRKKGRRKQRRYS